MRTIDLINLLRQRGTDFELAEDGIHWYNQQGIHPIFEEMLREHKDEVVAILRREQAVAPLFPFDYYLKRTNCCPKGHHMLALRQDNAGWNCRRCNPEVCR